MRMQIQLDDGRRDFKPREEIAGRVFWVLETAPDNVELRLFWYTEGKGTQDVEVVETASFGGLHFHSAIRNPGGCG